MEEFWIGILIAGFAVLVPLIVVLSVIAERNRTEALRRLATNLDYGFEAKPANLPTPAFEHFPLFNRGHSRRVRNLLHGGRGEQEVFLFDYRFTIGHGKNQHTHHQSVAAFPLRQQTLPEFELRPERIFHKIGAVFGYEDIDFPDDPQFSDAYLLKGRSEYGVRNLFGARLREAVRAAPGISIEGGGPWLIVYRHRQRLSTDRLPAFLEEARWLRAAFVRP